MKHILGPLSAVQIMAITHPSTAERNRSKIILNQARALSQVRGMSEQLANRYLNEHPLGKRVVMEWKDQNNCTCDAYYYAGMPHARGCSRR
jgi:hypothetical protein